MMIDVPGEIPMVMIIWLGQQPMTVLLTAERVQQGCLVRAGSSSCRQYGACSGQGRILDVCCPLIEIETLLQQLNVAG